LFSPHENNLEIMTISGPPSYLSDLSPSLKPAVVGPEEKGERSMSKYLVSSPYPGLRHHLEIDSVDETSRKLAVALQHLRPIKDDYPSAPYEDSFNWQQVVDLLPSDFAGMPLWTRTNVGDFYCIGFYSTLRKNVDSERLYYLDGLAHEEANQSGGLLKYWWQSPPNPETRKNLATCVWTSWDHAKKAGRLPMHGKAMSATRDSYERWGVERYYFKIALGKQWKLERIVV
jgi:hypothetical protein